MTHRATQMFLNVSHLTINLCLLIEWTNFAFLPKTQQMLNWLNLKPLLIFWSWDSIVVFRATRWPPVAFLQHQVISQRLSESEAFRAGCDLRLTGEAWLNVEDIIDNEMIFTEHLKSNRNGEIWFFFWKPKPQHSLWWRGNLIYHNAQDGISCLKSIKAKFISWSKDAWHVCETKQSALMLGCVFWCFPASPVTRCCRFSKWDFRLNKLKTYSLPVRSSGSS